MSSVAVFLQLHNDSQLDEWCGTVATFANFIKEKYTVHLYVTVLRNVEEVHRIILEKCSDNHTVVRAVDLVPNRGMDIGGFLCQLKKYQDELPTHDAVLKLHTKTDTRWKTKLITPFLRPDILEHIDAVQNGSIGMVGAQNCFSRVEYGEKHFTRLMECGVFKRLSNAHERVFVAGSIFMIASSILHRFINEPKLQKWILHSFTKCPIGRCTNYVPHAFERFFAYYTTMNGWVCRFV
jgi:hypothetical protein